MAIASIVNKGMITISDSTNLASAFTVGVVETATTLNVPGDFSTLQAALDWIEARVLLAEVTVQIADGTYNQGTTGFRFEHPNYALVNILGNTSTPSNVTFNFSGSAQAFRVNGSILKSLKGVKISGGTYGVFAHQGGQFTLVQDVEVTGVTSGPVIANDRSLIETVDVNVFSNSASGVQSMRNSYIYGQSIISNNTSNGWGFYVEYGGVITVNGYTATGNANGVANTTINTATAMCGVFSGS